MLFTDPFSLLADLERQFGEMSGGRPQARPGWLPAADVVADEHEVRVYVDAPGMRREDITVELDHGVLTIAGERRPIDVSRSNVQRIERGWGRWTRTMRLPTDLDADEIVADLAEGVLSIRVPVTESAKPRRIAIGTGAGPAVEHGERELAENTA